MYDLQIIRIIFYTHNFKTIATRHRWRQ